MSKTIVSLSMTRELLHKIDEQPMAKGNRSLYVENEMRKVFRMKEIEK